MQHQIGVCSPEQKLDVDEGRKRVLAIVAGILVARHLKTADDPVAED